MKPADALDHLRSLAFDRLVQLRYALIEWRIDGKVLMPAIMQMLSGTPEERKAALWVLNQVATYQPDSFFDCVGATLEGITVTPEAVAESRANKVRRILRHWILRMPAHEIALERANAARLERFQQLGHR